MGKTLFFEELIFLDEQFKTSDELFASICPKLLAGGWVKESFQEAVIAREKVFSTGLQTEPVAVAIPHTDAEHVKKALLPLLDFVMRLFLSIWEFPDKKFWQNLCSF